MLDPGSFI